MRFGCILLALTLFIGVVYSALPQCKKAWLDEGKTYVDLSALAAKNFYGPIPFAYNQTEGWHYFVNICAPTRVKCTSEEDHFEAVNGGKEKYITHDDYYAIQEQNMKMPDKDHVDCNYLSSRDVKGQRQFLTVKVTDNDAKNFKFEVVMANGEKFEWWDGQGNKRTGKRKTVIEITNNPEMAPGSVQFEDWFLESTNPPGVYKFRAFANMKVKKVGGGPFLPLGHFGFGGLFIVLGVFALIIYFVIGVIVQVVRGRRGIQVIPNLWFWSNLIFFIRDGITWLPETIIGLIKRRGGQMPSGDDVEQLYDEA